ncbi:MAG TPA: hypothetical protein PKC67_09615 [Kiritimatiellia bacterium]|nr:hypothetical protein [Kiritimatiellia bacterium]HMP34598.1 hypothetical protein [Kiritimatiellia bacterium]
MSGDDTPSESTAEPSSEPVCPVCGAPLVHEKCKLVCRSERCVYRIVFNCAEF